MAKIPQRIKRTLNMWDVCHSYLNQVKAKVTYVTGRLRMRIWNKTFNQKYPERIKKQNQTKSWLIFKETFFPYKKLNIVIVIRLRGLRWPRASNTIMKLTQFSQGAGLASHVCFSPQLRRRARQGGLQTIC